MSSAQAWAFVLSWMKMANAGGITRIQAEQMLERAIKEHPEQCERVGEPIHRVVEVAPAPSEDRVDGASEPNI